MGEDEFDETFGQIRAQGLEYWADPAHDKPGEVNTHDGGRGVYFDDPSGHILEIITRPYGEARGWSRHDASFVKGERKPP